MNDKLSNEENIKQLTQLEMTHKFEQKEKELEFERIENEVKLKEKIKTQRIIQLSLIVGLILLFLFIFNIYRNYKRKQKDNDLLHTKNNQIEKQKKDITDSIYYAKRIQTAVLPPKNYLEDLFKSLFEDFTLEEYTKQYFPFVAELNKSFEEMDSLHKNYEDTIIKIDSFLLKSKKIM